MQNCGTLQHIRSSAFGRANPLCVCVCVYVPKNGKQHKPKNNANNEFSNLCMYLCYFIWGCACFFFPFPYHHHHHHCTGVQIFAALQTNMQTSFEMEFLPKIEYSLDFSSLQWKKTRARTIFFSLIRLLLFRKRNSFLEKYKFILACFGIDFFFQVFFFSFTQVSITIATFTIPSSLNPFSCMIDAYVRCFLSFTTTAQKKKPIKLFFWIW